MLETKNKKQILFRLLLRKNNSYLLKLFCPILLAVAIYYYASNRAVDSIENFLLYVLGGIDIYNVGSFFDIIIFSIPFILYLYLFCDLILKNIDKASVFIFIRTKMKRTWLSQKIAFLFICTIAYYTILIITFTLLLGLNGIKLYSINTYINFVFIYFTNSVLTSFIFALLINILCIKYRNLAVMYSASIILYFFMQFILIPKYEAPNFIVVYWPSIQPLVFLHDIENLMLLDQSYFNKAIKGYTGAISFIYNSIAIIIIIIIGKNIIKNHDFI